jgi:hypothetical protein
MKFVIIRQYIKFKIYGCPVKFRYLVSSIVVGYAVTESMNTWSTKI